MSTIGRFILVLWYLITIYDNSKTCLTPLNFRFKYKISHLLSLNIYYRLFNDNTSKIKLLSISRASLVAQTVKSLPAMWETQV